MAPCQLAPSLLTWERTECSLSLGVTPMIGKLPPHIGVHPLVGGGGDIATHPTPSEVNETLLAAYGIAPSCTQCECKKAEPLTTHTHTHTHIVIRNKKKAEHSEQRWSHEQSGWVHCISPLSLSPSPRALLIIQSRRGNTIIHTAAEFLHPSCSKTTHTHTVEDSIAAKSLFGATGNAKYISGGRERANRRRER